MAIINNLYAKVLIILSSLVAMNNISSCSSDNASWKLDATYSEYLTIRSTNYKTITGNEIADTVDAIQIYKTIGSSNDFLSLSELLKKELVFENRDGKLIKSFLLAANTVIDNAGHCDNINTNRFHVLLFDHTLMRVGYFLYRGCMNNEGRKYGVIMSLQKGGGSSIYHVTPKNLPFFSTY